MSVIRFIRRWGRWKCEKWTLSEWVEFNTPSDTVQVISEAEINTQERKILLSVVQGRRKTRDWKARDADPQQRTLRTNRALSVDEQVENPRCADSVDSRNKNLVELKFRTMHILWNQLHPRNPTGSSAVPQVLEHGRLHACTYHHRRRRRRVRYNHNGKYVCITTNQRH